jgi:hypothetical protein
MASFGAAATLVPEQAPDRRRDRSASPRGQDSRTTALGLVVPGVARVAEDAFVGRLAEGDLGDELGAHPPGGAGNDRGRVRVNGLVGEIADQPGKTAELVGFEPSAGLAGVAQAVVLLVAEQEAPEARAERSLHVAAWRRSISSTWPRTASSVLVQLILLNPTLRASIVRSGS